MTKTRTEGDDAKERKGPPFSKVIRRMWRDAKFRRLSKPEPCGRYLWMYLLTTPELSSIPGMITMGEAALAEELEWPLQGLRDAFAEVLREGMAVADWKARLIWVPNAIKHNEPQSLNVVKSWRIPWEEAPECDLKAEVYASLRASLEAKGSSWVQAFDEVCPDPSRKACVKPSREASHEACGKPCAEPYGIQEQEQEQEQECETRAGARGHTPPEPSSAEDLPPETRERLAEVQRVFRERVAESAAEARSEQQLAAVVEAEFRQRYEAARPEAGPWETPARFWQAFLEIGRLAAGKPCGLEEALARALGAWFAADFPRTIDYRPTTLAEQFNQWFAPPGKTAAPKGPKQELIDRRAKLEDELNDARCRGATAEEIRIEKEIAKVNADIRRAASEAA